LRISPRRRLGLVLAGAAALAVAGSSRPGIAQSSGQAAARLAALETKLDALEHDITLLEDTKAIKRLQRAYAYYLDKGLASEITPLFSENATAEIGGYGVFVGKERIARLYDYLLGDGLAEGELNNHMIMQGVVDVAPDGLTAKGRWRALIQLGRHGESAKWSEGPYENEYVKEDGIWRISKLHWYMTLTAPYEPGWHLVADPMPGPLEELPPDRPPSEQYQSYPSAYLPMYHFDNPVSGRKAGGMP
jgi:hypothetical protein